MLCELSKNFVINCTQHMAKRMIWCREETEYMLKIFKEKQIFKILVAKKHRGSTVYKLVQEYMLEQNYVKSDEQIKIKWKALKFAYFKAKREKADCPFQREIEEILKDAPKQQHSSDAIKSQFEDDDNDSYADIRDTDITSDGQDNPHFILDCKSSIPVINSRTSSTVPSVPSQEITNSTSTLNRYNFDPLAQDVTSVCSPTPTMDEDEHYCLSLAGTLKRLTPKAKAKLKFDIQRLVYEAESEMYD